MSVRITLLIIFWLLSSCVEEKKEASLLREVDWAHPRKTQASDIVKNEKFKYELYALSDHLKTIEEGRADHWRSLLIDAALRESNYDSSVFCDLMSKMNLTSDPNKVKEGKGLARQKMLRVFELCDLEEKIKKEDFKLRNLESLEHDSLKDIEKVKEDKRLTYLSLNDYYIITGFVVSHYGEGVYEISNPVLYQAVHGRCTTSVDCQVSDSYFGQGVGFRAIVVLNDHHFKTKGIVRVLVHKRGTQLIDLKMGGNARWPVYEEASYYQMLSLKADLRLLSSSIQEKQRLHDEGQKKMAIYRDYAAKNESHMRDQIAKLISHVRELEVDEQKGGELLISEGGHEKGAIQFVHNSPSTSNESNHDMKTIDQDAASHLQREINSHEVSVKANPLGKAHGNPMPLRSESSQGQNSERVVPKRQGAVFEVFDTYKDKNGEKFLALKKKPYPEGRSNGNKRLGELLDGTRLKVISRRHGYQRAWFKVEVLSGAHKGKIGYAHSKWIRGITSQP